MDDREWFEFFSKLLNSPKAPKVGGHFGHLDSSETKSLWRKLKLDTKR